ncbi:MAG: ATP-binding protein [Nannocystales bacterium]
MNSTFGRLLLASLVAFVVAGMLAVNILWWEDPYADPGVVESAMRPGLHLARAELSELPEAKKSVRLRDMSVLFEGGIEFAPTAELPSHVRRRLEMERDVVSWFTAEEHGFVALPIDETTVLLQGPLDEFRMPSFPRWILALFSVLLVFGTATYIALHPLLGHLRDLQKASLEVSRGAFSARVPEQGPPHRQEVARAFNRMVERLTRTLGAQAELLRSVSHELRTPLARLHFRTELLQSAADEEARRAHALALDDDITALDGLVGELLQDAWLQHAGTAVVETVVVAEFLEKLVAARELPGVHSDLRIEVSAAGDVTLEVEPTVLSRALGNLLSNALRYAVSVVRITAEPAEGGVSFRVEDDGPGIEADARTRAFLPFEKAEQHREGRDGGTGLGLSIVRGLVASQGGEIGVGDSALGGCSMDVFWPTARIHSDTD